MCIIFFTIFDAKKESKFHVTHETVVLGLGEAVIGALSNVAAWGRADARYVSPTMNARQFALKSRVACQVTPRTVGRHQEPLHRQCQRDERHRCIEGCAQRFQRVRAGILQVLR